MLGGSRQEGDRRGRGKGSRMKWRLDISALERGAQQRRGEGGGEGAKKA